MDGNSELGNEGLNWYTIKNKDCESSGCVDFAETDLGGLALRDSVNPGHVLKFSSTDTVALIRHIKAGGLDALLPKPEI